MAAVRQRRPQSDRNIKSRRRGRCADPEKIRFVLHYKFGDARYTRFAALVAAKKWTIIRGDKRARLPSYSTVLRFCRGDAVDDWTLGVLCDDLGVPFWLLQKGGPLSESTLKETAVKSHWSCCHPASYVGPVWIQVTPGFENRSAPHVYAVRRGPWEYSSEPNAGGFESISLSHTKGDDGLSIPLFFDLSPPYCVAFGTGAPPTGLVHHINHGWTRVEGSFGNE